MSYSSRVKNFIPTSRSVAFCLMALAAVCTTGCLHRLGLNRSSLSPRASLTEKPSVLLASNRVNLASKSETTFRSQDSEFAADESSSGHSRSRTSTISLMRPFQAPTPQQEARPTPLPSMAAPTASYEDYPTSRQPVSESSSALQPMSQLLGANQTQNNGTLNGSEALDQRAADNRSSITLNPPAVHPSNSIGFNVDQLREFMNQHSTNAMTSGHVLQEKQARWDVLKSNQLAGIETAGQQAAGHFSAGGNQTAAIGSRSIQIIPGVVPQDSRNLNSASPNPFRTVGNSRELPVSTTVLERSAAARSEFESGGFPVSEVSVEQPFPTVNDAEFNTNVSGGDFETSAVGTPPVDDSMLTRLKGLYDPSEDGVARRIWNRQIPKLPNPWSVFRDREEPASPATIEASQFVEVETSDFNTPVEVTPSVTPAGTPLESTSLLNQLVTEYELRIANWPKTPAERIENPAQYRQLQQELRLLYLLQDRPEDAVSAVELLEPAQQQYFQSLVMSLAEYRNAQSSDSPSAHYTGSVHQLRAAVQALSPLADLRIRRFEICNRINSYGRIETFPSNDFDPGRPLLLYVELENFGTQLTASGRYLASFDATLQIVEKGKGLVKETIRLTDITDEATSARTDYFQSYDLTLPSHLMTGEYDIRIKIRDKFSGKTTEKSVTFQVR
ncbi:MAG: hypothetical protein ABJZ55_01325 [Fuerstiella sp.]